jgi:hypothetical protein
MQSVIGALSGSVTFNTSAALLSNPAACVDTVVFSQVTSSTGAVDALGLTPGWAGKEFAPSLSTQGGNLHQQLITPPAGEAAGATWLGSAQLVVGTAITAKSGSYSLVLQASQGTSQTWQLDGQPVSCG